MENYIIDKSLLYFLYSFQNLFISLSTIELFRIILKKRMEIIRSALLSSWALTGLNFFMKILKFHNFPSGKNSVNLEILAFLIWTSF